MRTSIRKWGNSNGVILPMAVIDNLKCRLGDELEIVMTDNGVLLTPAAPVYTLEEMLAGSKPEDFAMTEEDLEWEGMKPAGQELI